VSLQGAEQAALGMLGSPSSRAPTQDADRRDLDPVISESGEENLFWSQAIAGERKGSRTAQGLELIHFELSPRCCIDQL
jgi:hypothetical protein